MNHPDSAPPAAPVLDGAAAPDPAATLALGLAWEQLLVSGPAGERFFAMHGFGVPTGPAAATPQAWWSAQAWDEAHDHFGDYAGFAARLLDWQANQSPAVSSAADIATLGLVGGTDKTGRPEALELVFRPGEVVCLVGPTGAGKSRLLADIECLAQGDTPSRRRLLLDGRVPDERTRFSVERKLVAQISQNMNFVMDLGVDAFLRLHAESRGLDAAAGIASEVLARAVELAGEPFFADTPLTQLSGGQSRALMIADAAYLSPKPIVLIDEIENAGVDRQRALALFTARGKLVFLSTHDPLLALSGDRRLVIRQGGIQAVLETSPEEKKRLAALVQADRELSQMRDCLRRGEQLY